MVLLGLLFGFSLLGGHTVSFSDGVFRRWRSADGCGQTPCALYELHNILHRLPLSVATGLSLFVHWLQLHSTFVPPCEDISVLGVHGPYRETYELSELI